MHFDEIGLFYRELYNEIMNITVVTQVLWYDKNTVIINIGSRTIFIWASQKSVIALILLSFCLMVKKNHATFSTHHNYTQLKPIINRSLAPSNPHPSTQTTLHPCFKQFYFYLFLLWVLIMSTLFSYWSPQLHWFWFFNTQLKTTPNTLN